MLEYVTPPQLRKESFEVLRKPPPPHATQATVGGCAAVMTLVVPAPRWRALRLPQAQAVVVAGLTLGAVLVYTGRKMIKM